MAFLVVGDPFGATTHSDLVLRAKELGVPHQVLEYRPNRSKTAANAVVNIHREKVVHNASIMNAVGCCGLQLYNFGETVRCSSRFVLICPRQVSIPFWTETWQPESFYDKICENLSRGLHTLCLLDIKV